MAHGSTGDTNQQFAHVPQYGLALVSLGLPQKSRNESNDTAARKHTVQLKPKAAPAPPTPQAASPTPIYSLRDLAIPRTPRSTWSAFDPYKPGSVLALLGGSGGALTIASGSSEDRAASQAVAHTSASGSGGSQPPAKGQALELEDSTGKDEKKEKKDKKTPKEDKFPFFVKYKLVQTTVCDARRCKTIKDVKQRIKKIDGVNTDRMMVTCDGIELEDDAVCAEVLSRNETLKMTSVSFVERAAISETSPAGRAVAPSSAATEKNDALEKEALLKVRKAKKVKKEKKEENKIRKEKKDIAKTIVRANRRQRGHSRSPP